MSSYYDIEKILEDDERVPCTFRTRANRLGYLDPSLGADDLEEGTKLDLPLWMAEELARRNLVLVDLPVAFSVKTREDLLADPTVVRLRDKSPVFYEMGVKLSQISTHRDAAGLPALVRLVLATRANRVLDRAHNSLQLDVSEFVGTLTDVEQRIFTAGFEHARQVMAWRRRRGRLLAVTALESAVAMAGGGGGGDEDASKRRRMG